MATIRNFRIVQTESKKQVEREVVLDNAGTVTAEIAKSFAESEFDKYRIVQDRLFESDFDLHLKNLGKKEE